jgi:ABC-type Zn2+ transport system substrate-binding protein/surface adhesin
LIWTGPNIETFLGKTVATLSNQTQQLRLFELPHLTLLKIRKGGVWETTHSHGEDEEITPAVAVELKCVTSSSDFFKKT